MAKQSTVLVVDDEPDIAALLVALFESEGYRTVLASSGREALEFVAQVKPSAVMLDLSLPDLDGLQLLHLLKMHEKSAQIPVVVVSAYTGRLSPDDKALVNGIFEKPFDLDALADTVAKLCARDLDATAARSAGSHRKRALDRPRPPGVVPQPPVPNPAAAQPASPPAAITLV